jgi:hypothetical protein
VPRHLEKATGAKAQYERAILLSLGLLVGVKQKLSGIFCCFGRELPNDIDGSQEN